MERIEEDNAAITTGKVEGIASVDVPGFEAYASSEVTTVDCSVVPVLDEKDLATERTVVLGFVLGTGKADVVGAG